MNNNNYFHIFRFAIIFNVSLRFPMNELRSRESIVCSGIIIGYGFEPRTGETRPRTRTLMSS